MEWGKLIEEAFEARKTAYAPYSEFAVGAALLTGNGKVFRGCNIENAAFSPTNCAERTAIFKAVSEGERDFIAIAVCGGNNKSSTPEKNGKNSDNRNNDSNQNPEDAPYCFPCGVCRQVMMEFTNPKTFLVIVAKTIKEYRSFRLEELLPHGFGPDNLAK